MKRPSFIHGVGVAFPSVGGVVGQHAQAVHQRLHRGRHGATGRAAARPAGQSPASTRSKFVCRYGSGGVISDLYESTPGAVEVEVRRVRVA